LVGCLVARLLLPEPYRQSTHIFPTHLRVDSLGFGVLLSYWYHFRRDSFEGLRPFRLLLIAVGVAALAPAFLWPLEARFIHTFGLTLFYLGSGSILTGLLLCRLPESRLLGLVALVGAHSYSIYLWHMPVIRWLSLQSVWTAVFLSVLVGVVMARVVEFPVLRLRDRLFPSPVTPVRTPVASPPPTSRPEPAPLIRPELAP
jgi:peptidoglycan/LPS O-acetylase OafA/YrhL